MSSIQVNSGNKPSVVLLAAGVGKRLGAADGKPKVLLEFNGKSLLLRHIEALRAHGVTDIALTVGHQSDLIRNALKSYGFCDEIACIDNDRYREGSLVSLWMQRDRLHKGNSIILMDGDVLYDQAMIGRLLDAAPENVLLVDREIEPGDEPVKICFRDGLIVDFRKRPEHAHDWHGESVGFFRFSPSTAKALAERCDDYVQRGETGVEYEEAIRDLILREPSRFGAEDISDLAWTEIDFDMDVAKARDVVLPQIETGVQA